MSPKLDLLFLTDGKRPNRTFHLFVTHCIYIGNLVREKDIFKAILKACWGRLPMHNGQTWPKNLPTNKFSLQGFS